MSTLNLLDKSDLPWLTELIDIVTAATGQPWRVALERLDDTRRFEQPRAPVRFAAAVGAVQRVLGGRARNAARARSARALVLGRPALTPAEREARIAFAAGELDVSCAAVEALLWSDLPRERPIELPRGRPSELEIAAFANVQLLQRAVRRAQTVKLRIWGDAGPLIRGAALRGLLATIWLEARSPAQAHAETGVTSIAAIEADTTAVQTDTAVVKSNVTVIEIIGPLALFHRTAVYGKALADLVPLLADCAHFEIEIAARGPDGSYAVDVSSPALLPAVPARLAAAGRDMSRLCKELQREARVAGLHGFDVRRPPAVHAGASLVCPDLLIEHGKRRLYVEVLGFWTIEFVARKLALYRDAGIDDVVLCVDDSMGCTKEELSDDLPVLRYQKRVTTLAASLIGCLSVIDHAAHARAGT